MNTHIIKLILAFTLFSPVIANAHGENGSIGGGIGMAYGAIGFNYSPAITENLYFSLGIGFVLGSSFFDIDSEEDSVDVDAKSAYSLGFKYYFKEPSVKWRPRFLVLYGTNGVIERRRTGFFYFDSELETFEGLSAGFGQSVAFGSSQKHGFDLDLLFKIDDGGFDDRVDELRLQGYSTDESSKNVTLSIGYRYNF